MSKKDNYIARFAEVCGTDKPAEVAGKLQITYNAARNYLQGRMPDSSILIKIAEKTSYSIHWLLTGEGEKIVSGKSVGTENTIIPTDQISELVRNEVVKFFGDALKIQTVQASLSNLDDQNVSAQTAKPQVVRLKTAQIKREKTVAQIKYLSHEED